MENRQTIFSAERGGNRIEWSNKMRTGSENVNHREVPHHLQVWECSFGVYMFQHDIWCFGISSRCNGITWKLVSIFGYIVTNTSYKYDSHNHLHQVKPHADQWTYIIYIIIRIIFLINKDTDKDKHSLFIVKFTYNKH